MPLKNVGGFKFDSLVRDCHIYYVTVYGKTHHMGLNCLMNINFDKLYHRANLRSSFRLIARFALELQHFFGDHATPPIVEKLQSKDLAMQAYSVSVYQA